MKVAIIERDRFGGTCVNTGCTPTKTLVASAYAVHMARRGADYGFSTGGEVTVDMKRVKARKDDVVGALAAAASSDRCRSCENCTVYRGHARFVSAREVEVGTRNPDAPAGSSSMSAAAPRCPRFPAWSRSTTSPTAR